MSSLGGSAAPDALPTLAGDLSLHEAAELLGVHYMTAYRYVRLGLLPADKLGASWRVRLDDVELFRAGHDAGGGNDADRVAADRRRVRWDERLEARLVAGDGSGSWGVIEAALAAGREPAEIYLDVIAPAMSSIGARWALGEIDVAAEHRASIIATRLVGRLGPRFARRGQTRGAVVVGAPAGETHALPVAMLADLLRGAGWDVSDLGGDVPAESFAKIASRTERLFAVGVSVSHPDWLDAAATTIAVLRRQLYGVPIMAGGRAIGSSAVAAALGADAWASDGKGAIEVLDRLGRGEASESDELRLDVGDVVDVVNVVNVGLAH